jgi:lysophospholipase L1-like esterase
MTLKLKTLLFALLLCCNLLHAQEFWKKDIQHFATLDSLQSPGQGMILFVGSSSIVKWKTLQEDFPGHKILNRAFGGSQFPDLIYYVAKVIYPYNPSKIFIYEGDNDLASGRSPEQVIEDAKTLRGMIAKRLPNVPVVFISLKPSISRWKLKNKYLFVNYELKKYASQAKLTQYADVWTPMIGKNGEPLPVFVEDNLHMTPEGYRIWQKALKPYLD